MLKKKVNNYSKLFTLQKTNTFLSTFQTSNTRAKPKAESFYKLSLETADKPFKISTESTNTDSPHLIEKQKLRISKKNTLFSGMVGSSGKLKLKTRNKIISPPERVSEVSSQQQFDNKNLTTTSSFPKVLTLNSYQIDDFSLLSFGESTPNLKKTNTQTEVAPENLKSPLKTDDLRGQPKNYYQAKTFSHRCYKSKGKVKMPRTHNKSLSPSNIFLQFAKYPNAKYSTEPVNQYLKSYAVNSYKGLIRNYNEDKVSIILSITKPKNVIVKEGEQWPQNCSLFAIYDGHGGSKCCNFLRDHLHNYIIKNKYFPRDPERALVYAFERAEKDFIYKIAVKEEDKSGSCALVALLMDDVCYFANCGDSRAIASFNGGKTISVLTKDHKPNDPEEKKRIIDNGGNVYSNKQQTDFSKLISTATEKEIFRIVPGHLSVSRAFGDIDAKLASLGGKWGVLIPTPEITKVDLSDLDNKIDYIFMGCDGIYDRLSSEDVASCIGNVIDKKVIFDGVHTLSGGIVDMVMKTALKRKTTDNLTAMFLTFQNFLEIYKD